MSLRKTNIILKIINSALYDLPSPSNINYLWNFGSLLGCCLTIQLIRGIFLSFHFINYSNLSFDSISHIIRDVNYGWFIRNIHANGASFFFIFIYSHIGRNIFYKSYFLTPVWLSGIIILLILIATAFLGYVLPWGQMSFWGATVITNLLRAIPYIGQNITYWIWGGFAVRNSTLSRFFSFHFLLPFILTFLVIIHISLLHITGSSNPIGTPFNIDKIPFYPFFIYKDLLRLLLFIFFLIYFSLINPFFFLDPENYIQANPIITPVHIQPEWYFLFAYAILRSIPNKLGGVLGLLFSILILLFLPLSYNIKPLFNNSIYKCFFSWLINIFLFLTILGAAPVEIPYIFLAQIFTFIYFRFFFIIIIL